MTDVPSHSEPDAADLDGYYDKFYVHDASEIRHHLRRLAGARGVLSVRAESSQDGMATMLLQVDDDTFLIDVPSTRRMLDAWLGSLLLRVEGSIDRAALRFSSGPARLDDHEGKPALRVPIPERMLYLQRREFMRREPPPGALVCHLRLEDGREIQASIRDIGGGGLAIVATRSAVEFQVNEVLTGCRIELPDLGDVEVNLQIRHVVVRSHLGLDAAQAGCEFVDLAPVAQRKLFRYLMQLDRDQLARRRWLE
ncbi:flagellar brake protein [Thermomonas brevis]